MALKSLGWKKLGWVVRGDHAYNNVNIFSLWTWHQYQNWQFRVMVIPVIVRCKNGLGRQKGRYSGAFVIEGYVRGECLPRCCISVAESARSARLRPWLNQTSSAISCARNPREYRFSRAPDPELISGGYLLRQCFYFVNMTLLLLLWSSTVSSRFLTSFFLLPLHTDLYDAASYICTCVLIYHAIKTQ